MKIWLVLDTACGAVRDLGDRKFTPTESDKPFTVKIPQVHPPPEGSSAGVL